jgi:hypothetical protein
MISTLLMPHPFKNSIVNAFPGVFYEREVEIQHFMQLHIERGII